jgi:hypothetical protein
VRLSDPAGFFPSRLAIRCRCPQGGRAPRAQCGARTPVPTSHGSAPHRSAGLVAGKVNSSRGRHLDGPCWVDPAIRQEPINAEARGLPLMHSPRYPMTTEHADEMASPRDASSSIPGPATDPRDVEQVISRLAARQHGVVTRAQLMDIGLSAGPWRGSSSSARSAVRRARRWTCTCDRTPAWALSRCFPLLAPCGRRRTVTSRRSAPRSPCAGRRPRSGCYGRRRWRSCRSSWVGCSNPYRRLWASERRHLPDVDVAAAGGWKDTQALRLSYQHADAEGVLAAVNGG